MIIVLLADGFEEIEALTPVDMLRRAGLTVKTVGISGRAPTGAHGIGVVCDLIPEEVDLSRVDTVILPGGMPGTLNLDAAPFTDKAINDVLSNGGRLAAICAAPIILGRRGLLEDRAATCYPGFEKELSGALLSDKSVVTDDNITTARGMGVALEFAEELISLSLGAEKAEEISRTICKDTEVAQCDEEDFAEEEIGGIIDPIKACGIDTDEQTAEEKPCPDFSGYKRPSADLLSKENTVENDTTDEIAETADRIIATLEDNGVKVCIADAERGPRITKFLVTAEGNTPLQKILSLQQELALALRVASVRMELPILGRNGIGIEIPNKTSSVVGLRGLATSDEFKNEESIASVCLGRDVGGKPVIADITKMPHLLVAGATGMGKSAAIHSMLASVLLKADPDQLKLIMIDPKCVEFTSYNGIPHLLCPIICEHRQAAGALNWAVDEMERRYSLLAASGARNILSYNKMADKDPSTHEKLPFIIIVIDELADLMLAARDTIETLIMRLAQKARAAGIHMIIGTQRPSSSVITPILKANIPSRLCFKVASAADSRTVLDSDGGEKLLDRGDALYSAPVLSSPLRIQCAFISDSEIEEITDVAKTIGEGVGYDPDLAGYIKDYIFKLDNTHLFDRQFLDAVDIALNTGKISTSLIQRSLMVGYAKAAKFIDTMESLGIVTEMIGQRPREVIMTREEWERKLSKIKNH